MVEVVGFETESAAAAATKKRIDRFKHCRSDIRNQDFLEFAAAGPAGEYYDIVITNPPYVRTQQLGQKRSRELARQFHLTGRVDLYQAFTAAITQLLVEDGLLGLLTSNRFMYVQSGMAMRSLLQQRFELLSIFDLGDTGFFDAAVLPVVVIGRKSERGSANRVCQFTRVCRRERHSSDGEQATRALLGAIGYPDARNPIEVSNDHRIERGRLEWDRTAKRPWTLSNRRNRRWLQRIARYQVASFFDMADIRVGIKTTADAVFIRDNWDQLDRQQRPEDDLLKPLITHQAAERWSARTPQKRVLYPYQDDPHRKTIELERYPCAAHYLNQYRERLSSRGYLIEAGRRWFELWVPHQPRAWTATKLVWPDICEHPKFFLDRSGAVVNGDCYWAQLKSGIDSDWLYLMLAVANSTVATQFYDYRFHNKLYARRRRFMTQYVGEFPLPDLSRPVCQEIVNHTQRLLDSPPDRVARIQTELQWLVEQAFDLPASSWEAVTCCQP